jgi:hypothetical protein
MICSRRLSDDERKTFSGKGCVYEFLKYLAPGAVVYFFNLTYDGSFFADFITKPIIKNGRKY